MKANSIPPLPKHSQLSLHQGEEISILIGKGWSPQIISGRLKFKLGRSIISHEVIYQWIYTQENQLIDWFARGHRKRRKRALYGTKRIQIPDRTPIENRDQEANCRADFGYLEADTIVSRESTFSICASIDRKTRFVRLVKMKRCTAMEMIRAFVKSWSPR